MKSNVIAGIFGVTALVLLAVGSFLALQKPNLDSADFMLLGSCALFFSTIFHVKKGVKNGQSPSR